MASTLTHLFIVFLGILFPEKYSIIGLAVGSQIPDLEAFYMFIISQKKRKNVVKAFLNSGQGFLHTFVGSVITIPIGFFLSWIILATLQLDFNPVMIFNSVFIGLTSHLILDVPGHRDFRLFYPVIVKPNPYLFKKRLGWIERFYPWRNKEETNNQVLPEYNWWVFSHVFLLLAVIIIVLYHKFY